MAILKNTTLNTNAPVQLPSGTTAQRPSSPSPGAMRFNSELGYVEVYTAGGWVDASNSAEGTSAGAGNGATTICYIPLYGDSASNQDITDQISGTVGTINVPAGSSTRNNTVGGYAGTYFTGGAYFQMNPPQFGGASSALQNPTTLNGRRYWTVEWWAYWTGGSGTNTMCEFSQYTGGLLYRENSSYWRGAATAWGGLGAQNAWVHHAIVGYGTSIKVFQNGTQVADAISTTANSAFADPWLVYAGGFTLSSSNHTIGSQYINATFRKFRVSLGARYLTNFTSSTVYPI